ncbi:hypothetical protein [Extibacter muris]|uniref:hypothetical protein n=1 Tax=Extibacter muris TaxID=1796622 RepID=UPI001D0948A8|nr:hypothetical protein [Extibacter muris]MCB6200406.1 hypothetical protein [Extibacter muris]MCQ4663483.1 hypothetical protein [Extibacter muris]MCQ4692907.1 hypothetical protein [Extibacter muris]
MEKKSFLKSKEGGLTVAFVVILIAFVLILAGLKMQGDGMCAAGFVLMAAAMLYSPLKVYVLDRIKKS